MKHNQIKKCWIKQCTFGLFVYSQKRTDRMFATRDLVGHGMYIDGLHLKMESFLQHVLSSTVGDSGGLGSMPIGMRMKLAHAQSGPPIKLVELRGDDPKCITQVKRLIPQMCDSEPQKRPKAGTVTDVLGECLGRST